jgi:hypothetical protein
MFRLVFPPITTLTVVFRCLPRNFKKNIQLQRKKSWSETGLAVKRKVDEPKLLTFCATMINLPKKEAVEASASHRLFVKSTTASTAQCGLNYAGFIGIPYFHREI